jgi:hypothetical protein
MSEAVREWRTGLAPDDISIIEGCLRAAVVGPFFPDRGFSTLFGLERSEVAEVWGSWPQTEHPTEQWRAVSGSMNNLLGYPHHRDDAWDEYIPASRDQVEALYWRISEDSGAHDRTRAYLAAALTRLAEVGVEHRDHSGATASEVIRSARRYGVPIPAGSEGSVDMPDN